MSPTKPPKRKPIVVASDAQADTAPTGGYLLSDPSDNVKAAAFFKFNKDFLNLVGFTTKNLNDGANPIAQCEAAAVFMVVLSQATRLA